MHWLNLKKEKEVHFMVCEMMITVPFVFLEAKQSELASVEYLFWTDVLDDGWMKLATFELLSSKADKLSLFCLSAGSLQCW